MLDTHIRAILYLVIVNGHDMYKLHTWLSGLSTVEDHISIINCLSTAINTIFKSECSATIFACLMLEVWETRLN